ncbi:outer membrane usher protein [Arenicella xantha]|uniref:Outer membrane usher protein n=1 Tax=Arenicella xantha TaxID=644221 RepID=A0A395JNS0_9GAMM|nr:outer membrane usher protein [Arenicella xantha]
MKLLCDKQLLHAGRGAVLCLTLVLFSSSAQAASDDAISHTNPRALKAAQKAAQVDILAVEVNGELVSSGSKIIREDDQLWVPLVLLTTRRFVVPTDRKILLRDDYIELTQLPTVSIKIDQKRQLLSLEIDPRAFASRLLSGSRSSYVEPMANVLSMFGNYNITATRSGSLERANALFELGVTLENSTIASQFLMRDVTNDAVNTRLDTAWIKDFPSMRSRFTLGDAISTPASGSSLGSAYRFGGIQWGTRFEIEPGFIRYPVPKLYGEAATQSTVDLFINESLRYRTESASGPFVIDRPPVSNGAGEIQVVVTDLTGREQVFTTPFYVSTNLLSRGTSDYEVNLGALREEYSIQSNRYGTRFAAGRYRRGLSDWFTGDVIGEWSQDHRLIGVAGSAALAQVGVVSVSAMASDAEVGAGTSLSASIERQVQRFGFGVRGRRFSPDFRQLGSADGRNRIESDWTASVRFAPMPNSSASLVYSNREFDDASSSEVVSLAYTQRLGRNTNLTLSGSVIQGREFASVADGLNDFKDYNVNIALSHAFGADYRGSAKVDVKRSVRPDAEQVARSSLSFRRSAPRDLGYGYRLRVDHSDNSDAVRGVATLDVNTRTSLWNFSAVEDEFQSTLTASTQGSFVVAKRNVFLQRPLRTGFALVDLAGYSDVDIYRGNRLATRSNRDGYAIVTDLLPYGANEVSVDPTDLPLSATISTNKSKVVPYFRGGVEIDFGVAREYAALITLLTPDGDPLPIGTRAVERMSGQSYTVAQRGQVYLKGLDKPRRFDLQYRDLSCSINVFLEEFDDEKNQTIAPLECDLK